MKNINLYKRKLYALLRNITENSQNTESICQYLDIFKADINELYQWWETQGHIAATIGSSSDRVNLNVVENNANTIELRHPISGQKQTINHTQQLPLETIAAEIQTVYQRFSQQPKITEEEKIIQLYWWCWRFYPQLLASFNVELLNPAHTILPDCSHHSYNSTVSALVGAMFPQDWQKDEKEKHPYLLIFTFSPVQEFIKASRKFLDFWSGSYLLHYLSAILCWEVAQKYGPDAVITPSLWSQEIIDALLLKHYPDFQADFHKYEGTDPIRKFWDQDNPPQSLCTAGFPNVITVLVGSKDEAIKLGKDLEATLKSHWQEMARKVREVVKKDFIANDSIDKIANGDKLNQRLQKIEKDLLGENPSEEAKEELKTELKKLRQPGCWEWNKLWDAQINHSWETYFVAVPLGNPEQDLQIQINSDSQKEWIEGQNQIADIRITQQNNDTENPSNQKSIPTEAELNAYNSLNVGTWWGSFQGRLGKAIQAIKNTRSWQIPVASGERSTLSGQYTALHPRFLYQNFYNGLGLPLESLRLFWQVMAVVYPGVFNGSEKLNAIELTKRLAWKHGGVADSLGIKLNPDDDYEGLIRFPNLCSIAAANFATYHPKIIQSFWSDLRQQIEQNLELQSKNDEFCSRTHRPFQVRRADAAVKALPNYKKGLNGVMFSSKWLADDMNLNAIETSALRTVVDTVQRKYFGDGSPADWWVLVLGDGDGMGQYVNGSKLKPYADYIVTDLVDSQHKENENWQQLLETKKRIGPATHVGLNRALLDFSNRLVPYLTEQRYCGKVIYSGGDDVMAALPLADLPGFLQSLRAAWCGGKDPENEFKNEGGYWEWENAKKRPAEIPGRPLFTMGEGATMSLGIVIAHKSVPLPTVLESIWDAEKERAKKLSGVIEKRQDSPGYETIYPNKDGLCFRVIYGSGNTLEALLKGHLLPLWWKFIQAYQEVDFSPVLYRLAEELPRHADVTKDSRLFHKAAQVILASRDEQLDKEMENALLGWLDAWEQWAWGVENMDKEVDDKPLGTKPEDLANLLRFSAFLVSRRQQEVNWGK
ncbi:type III-B CRISPR-associated protein Cas10/Cmr2 [Anabaena azotica]|uniref:type III-B CRISPR-associated protein Cas10/Cmr2 n=1 Tax=Anabaena azotica TaxID=197653 RepID=UPI0039A4F63D